MSVKVARVVSNYTALLKTNYIHSPFLIEALLIFIKTVHISSLNWLPLHKIILYIHCTVSKFTDPYFTKRTAVHILKNLELNEGIFSLSFLLTALVTTFLQSL